MNEGGLWAGCILERMQKKQIAGLSDTADTEEEMAFNQVNDTSIMAQGVGIRDAPLTLTTDLEVPRHRSHFKIMRSRYMVKLLFEAMPSEEQEQFPPAVDIETQPYTMINSRNLAHFRRLLQGGTQLFEISYLALNFIHKAGLVALVVLLRTECSSSITYSLKPGAVIA